MNKTGCMRFCPNKRKNIIFLIERDWTIEQLATHFGHSIAHMRNIIYMQTPGMRRIRYDRDKRNENF